MNIREVIARLNPYAAWVQIKDFTPNNPFTRHSQSVQELPNNVIKKSYDAKNAVHREWFEAERRTLDYLTRMGCTLCPKLLFVDELNTTLYMTKCGEAPIQPTSTLPAPGPQTPELIAESKRLAAERSKQIKKEEKEIHDVLIELEQRYGVSYKPNAGKKLYSYPNHQTARRGGKITILDFHDSKMWTLNPPKNAFNPIQDTDPIKPITPNKGSDPRNTNLASASAPIQ